VGDAAPLLLALDARVNLAGPAGSRQMPLNEFFPDYRKTSLLSGEVLVSVIVPRPFPQLAAFFKIAKRALDDISTVAAAFAITQDRAGRIASCRLAFGGMAATPVRVPSAEAALTGRAWDVAAVAAAQRAIGTALRPMDDHRGSATYRMALAQSLLEKFLCQTCDAEAA